MAASQADGSPPDTSAVMFDGPWTHRDISANGIKLHVVEAGTGPLVVLLHGFGQFWWSWRNQLEELPRRGFRAVAVDLRGYGATDKPPRGYDAFTLAGDTSGLIRALGEPNAVVAGTGIGGLNAFNVAAIQPRQVRAVIAVGSAHPMTLARLRRPRRAGGYRRMLGSARFPWYPERRLAAANGAGLERIVRRGAGPAWQASADFAETAQQLRRAIRIPGVAHLALEHMRWLARSPWRADGARHRDVLLRNPVEVPVLHISGEGDPIIGQDMLEEAPRYCAGGYQLHVVRGVGHYPAEESPERVTDLIADLMHGLG